MTTLAKTQSKHALLSWTSNAISSGVALVLLVSWISDLREEQELPSPRRLSPSFFRNGFCLAEKGLFENTHLVCAGFDLVCGVVCLVAATLTRFQTKEGGKVSSSSSVYVGIAAYLLSHSYGHYVAGTELVEPGSAREERMGLADLVVLSAILSIGPFGGFRNLVKSGKMKETTANGAAVLTLLLMVSIYAIFIRRPCYALLYINVTILLTDPLPQLVFIGFMEENDVAYRSAGFAWPKFCTELLVAAVVFCEPFYCDSFVSKMGGHLIFDASLALDALASTFVTGDDPKRDEKKKMT